SSEVTPTLLPGYSDFTPNLGPLYSGVTPEIFRLYSKLEPSSLQGYSGVTQTLLQCWADFTPESLRLYSKVGPTSLQGYSRVTQTLLQGSSVATPALLQPYSRTTQSLLCSCSRLLRSYSKADTQSFLSTSVEVAQDSIPTQILLRSYSRSGRGLYSALTPQFLNPCSELTPGSGRPLLRVYSEFTQPLRYSGPPGRTYSGLTPTAPRSPPPFLRFLCRYSHFTPGVRSSLLCASSALTQPRPCSEVAQPLLGDSSAFTQRLLSLYLEVIPLLLRRCSAFTPRLLSLYSDTTRPPLLTCPHAGAEQSLLQSYSHFTPR
ncbi:uncharacterized protein LOC111944055, partial [Cyanistes caeruleus]|uniref:uncharacterized protein LOC111944055 n=1 Tax=Cyanistes caeruleus TaxID=156563 RepID=UPI000CDA0DCF